MTERHIVYHLSAKCPQCGAPARLRNTPKGIQLLRIAIEQGFDPDERIQSYQCARELRRGRTCNTIFYIRLRDWTPVEDI